MTLPHCTKLPQRKALGLVTHDNTGGPFVVECQGCGEVYPSFHCLGGQQIADTGDHEDARCPYCDQVDPEECDNAGLAWNTQQLKINALQERLTAADERNDEAIDLLRRARAVIEGGGWADLERDIAKFFKPAEGDGKPCACPGCDSPRRANTPFCVAHRSVKSRTRGQDPLTADGLEWLMQNDGHQQ